MKKFLMTVAALSLALAAAAQPQLTKDNIEDIIKAMTLQTVIYYLLASLAVLFENRWLDRKNS